MTQVIVMENMWKRIGLVRNREEVKVLKLFGDGQEESVSPNLMGEITSHYGRVK